jgi:hypothetical protein
MSALDRGIVKLPEARMTFTRAGTSLTLALVMSVMTGSGTAVSQSTARVDHVMLGVADLTAGSAYLSTRLGVVTAYGGKHPTGSHNALLSLGPGRYLELIAPQPGAAPTTFLSRLSALQHPTPVAWAVAGDDLDVLRQRLTQAGFHLTNPEPGSRKTPGGATLRWQTFALSPEIPGAPFFIVWSKSSPHPSTTSPSGCSLGRLSASSPDAQALTRLTAALELAIDIVPADTFAMTVTLKCPTGEVSLTNP